MRITQIVVEVEHMVSDDNYGRARAQARLTADLDPLDVPHETLRDLLEEASEAIEEELLNAPSVAVRRKVATGRKVDTAKQIAERERELAAAIGVEPDDDDDGPPF